ncbi:hypothetical protein [Aeromicrobium sp. UC242_57]|uniref:hypothetical protein n=1 Tax=Aeromicrobium sp. UC242_57 TaxID=3374624 RepID=UPI0037B60AF0
MLLLGLRGCGDQPVDVVGGLVGIAGHRDRDEHRVALVGDDRRPDAGDALDVGAQLGDLAGDGLGAGDVEGALRGRDEDGLGGARGQVGGIDHRGGLAGLADAEVFVADLLALHRRHEGDRGDHERDPQADGAPTGGERSNAPPGRWEFCET